MTNTEGLGMGWGMLAEVTWIIYVCKENKTESGGSPAENLLTLTYMLSLNLTTIS
jgi:hypothetical protein